MEEIAEALEDLEAVTAEALVMVLETEEALDGVLTNLEEQHLFIHRRAWSRRSRWGRSFSTRRRPKITPSSMTASLEALAGGVTSLITSSPSALTASPGWIGLRRKALSRSRGP